MGSRLGRLCESTIVRQNGRAISEHRAWAQWRRRFLYSWQRIRYAYRAFDVRFTYRLELPFPASIAVIMGTITFVGLALLIRAIAAYRLKKEWELRVDSRAMRWYERDIRSERIEGEIEVSEIEELIYEPSDGVGSLEVRFSDGSLARIPSLHLDTEMKIQEFARYWRSAHTRIPIRNLKNA